MSHPLTTRGIPRGPTDTFPFGIVPPSRYHRDMRHAAAPGAGLAAARAGRDHRWIESAPAFGCFSINQARDPKIGAARIRITEAFSEHRQDQSKSRYNHPKNNPIPDTKK